MKNLIAINLMVLVVIVLSSITANANILKANENLLVNRMDSCSKQTFCE
jgi:hypothetical protein